MPVHLTGGTSRPGGRTRVHLSSADIPRPKRYRFGDRREIGGVIHVRCRVLNRRCGAYVVNGSGTYKVDWVPEKDVDNSGLWPVRKN